MDLATSSPLLPRSLVRPYNASLFGSPRSLRSRANLRGIVSVSQIVARNAEGYLGFRVPLGTAAVHPGRNVLAVFVDPDGGAGFSPLNRSSGRGWYEGAGIYRHSRLVRAAPLQIGPNGVVARSTIEWREGHPDTAQLAATATVVNTGASAAAAGHRIVFTLVETATGVTVGTSSSAELPPIAPGASASVSGSIRVASPRLWAARSPELYTVMAELQLRGAITDAVRQLRPRFGPSLTCFSQPYSCHRPTTTNPHAAGTS